MVLQNDDSIKLLNTIQERADLLEKAGLDNLIIHPFDQKFSQMEAHEFVKTILVEQFQIKKIIIGYDHRFGKNRSADINDLIAFGKIYNFEVEQISAEEIQDVSVSSTKIRKALNEGNMALANEYLGYDYFLNGTVVKGKQLGRTIGFPTANIELDEDYKLVPKNGVYIVCAKIEDQLVNGMMNIGFNPTVEGKNKTIEVHLFDFNSDLYNHKIKISIKYPIRSEQKFESIAVLKQQLIKDKEFSIQYLSNL